MSRFKCHSDLYEMDLMLDINVSIYPVKVHHLRVSSDAHLAEHATPAGAPCMPCVWSDREFSNIMWALTQSGDLATLCQVGEKISLALAPTINLDNTPTDGTYNAVREALLHHTHSVSC